MPIRKKLRPWLLGLIAFSGCHQLQDCIDDQVASCTNKHRAKMAWCACRPDYVGCQDNLWDFGSGFRKGYEDVLNGSSTCPPAVPPRNYWSVWYQNDGGRASVSSWYDGYQHGVAVANADGYGGSGTIPLAPGMIQNHQRPVAQIDEAQIKAYRDGHAAPGQQSLDLSPLPALPQGDIEYGVPPMAPPYSPTPMPAPPEEVGPSAMLTSPYVIH